MLEVAVVQAGYITWFCGLSTPAIGLQSWCVNIISHFNLRYVSIYPLKSNCNNNILCAVPYKLHALHGSTTRSIRGGIPQHSTERKGPTADSINADLV